MRRMVDDIDNRKRKNKTEENNWAISGRCLVYIFWHYKTQWNLGCDKRIHSSNISKICIKPEQKNHGKVDEIDIRRH